MFWVCLLGLLCLATSDFTLTGEIIVQSPTGDFNRPDNSDTSYSFGALDFYGRPTASNSPPSSFSTWWRTDTSNSSSYPYTMNFVGTGPLYTFARTAFHPQATTSSLPPSNGPWKPFALRVRGIASSSQSVMCGFAGDWAIYGNGVLLCSQAGVLKSRTSPITCSITSGQQIDVFVAYRAPSLDLQVQIQLPQMSSGTCSVATQQQLVNGIYPFTSSMFYTQGTSVTGTSTAPILQMQLAPLDVKYAYSTMQIRPNGGFQTSFQFSLMNTGTTNAEGFAFVIQGYSSTAIQGSGNQFGLDFANSLAVKFDTSPDSGDSPITQQFLGVQTCYTNPNSGSASCTVNTMQPGFNMSSGQTYEASIEYTPGTLVVYLSQPNQLLSAGGAWTTRTTTTTNKWFQTTINHASFMNMFATKLAYVGFTTSSSNSNPATLKIWDWRVFQVPVAPLMATASGTTPAITGDIARAAPAGTGVLFTLFDACGQKITAPGEWVQATLVDQVNFPAVSFPMPVTANPDGTFYVNYYYNKTNAVNIELFVQIDGEYSKLSPSGVESFFPINITAAPIAALNCSAWGKDSTGTIFKNFTSHKFLASSVITVYVDAADQFGNNNSNPVPSDFSVYFANQAPYAASSWNGNELTFTMVQDTLALAGQTLFIKYQGADTGGNMGNPWTVNVLPDILPDVNTSQQTITGSGLYTASIATPASATFTLKDHWSNDITDFTAGGFPGGLSASATLTCNFACASAPATPTVTMNPGNPPTTLPSFTVSYSSTVAGPYILSICITHAFVSASGPAAGQTQCFTNYTPNIAPGDEYAPNSILIPVSNGYSAGVIGKVNIQAADMYTNNRTAGNTNGPFTVQVGSGGTAVNVICGTPGVVSTGSTEVQNVSCTANNQGVVTVQFVPQYSENLTFAVQQPSKSSTFYPLGQVFVQPGGLCPSCDNITVAAGSFTIVAGTWGNFTVNDFDQFFNKRHFSADSGFYVPKLTQPANPQTVTQINNPTVMAAPNDYLGNYLFNGNVTGWYNLTTTLLGQPLANSGIAIIITPSYTILSKSYPLPPAPSYITGPGLQGGQSGNYTWIQLVVLDGFGNINNYSSTGDANADTITCCTQLTSASENCTVAACSTQFIGSSTCQGCWNLTFQVPPYVAPYNFTVNIKLTPKLKPILQTLQLPMSMFQGSQNNYAMLYPDLTTDSCPGNSIGTVNFGVWQAAQNNDIYLRHHGTIAPCGDTSKLAILPTWTVKFVSTAGPTFTGQVSGTNGNAATCQPQAPGTQCYYEQIYFYAVKTGAYNITVFAGALQTDQSSRGGLYITIVPGVVYAPKCFVTGQLDGITMVAGTISDFTITLADAESNQLIVSPNDAAHLVSGISATVGGQGQILNTNSWFGFTAVGSASPADVAGTVNATKAGQLLVSLIISQSTPTLTESKIFKVTVIPAALSFAKFVNSPLDLSNPVITITPNAVAGNVATVYIQATDFWGNLLTDQTIQFGLTLNNGDPTMTPTVLTQYLQPGLYQITFTTTKTISGGNLVASYKGTNVTSALLNVDPNDIDPTMSWVVGLNGTQPVAQAGVLFAFSFYARDRYGNPWVFTPDQQAQKVQVQFVGLAPGKPAVNLGPNAILSNKTNPGGVFNYWWLPTLATTATNPNYNLTIQCTGNGNGALPVTYVANFTPSSPINGQVPVMVAAGPPYAVKTKYPFLAGVQIPAGTPYSFLISLYDQYGNQILKAGYNLSVNFYAAFPKNGITPYCNGNLPDENYNNDTRFSGSPYYSDQGNGSFLITIRAVNASYYSAFVKVLEAVPSSNPLLGTEVGAGTASECDQCISTCANTPFTFQIVPLYPNATTSFLTDGVITNPTTAIAGTKLNFTIVLRDMYYNPVGKGGWNIIEADATHLPNDYSNSDCGGDPTYWLDAPYKLTDQANGNYTVNFIAEHAQTVGVVYLLQNASGGGEMSAIEWPSCHNLTIQPWYVAWETRFYYFNDTPTATALYTFTEGLENFGMFHGYDPFNNSVAQGPFYWLDTTDRTSMDYLAPYEFRTATFRPVVTDDFQISLFIAHHPGNYSFILHFVQDPKYLDQSLFPLRDPTDKYDVSMLIIPRACASRVPNTGNFTCPDESCASSINNCLKKPTGSGCTSRKCATGYACCADGRTCVGINAQCPSSSASAAQIGTDITCSDGSIPCSDGSCGGNCDGVVIYSCLSKTPFKCPDGSCRASVTDCPTGVTCQQGGVLCNSGHCVTDKAMCAQFEQANGACPPTETRCWDGTCQTNPLLCPTGITCPSQRPYLCADRSCVANAGLCRAPKDCSMNPTLPFPCPDGSCAVNTSQCPTPPVCPYESPVLCEDFTCALNLNMCTGPNPSGPSSLASPPTANCPLHLPFKCFDGTCAATQYSCPSGTICSPDSPVKCADSACAVASNTCPVFNCSALGLAVTCPGGGCATAYSECPTSITCPMNQVRCADGGCRSSCYGIARHPTTFCSFPLLNCPAHEAGFQCAFSASDCALAPACPATRPIRCLDRKCVESIEFCPPASPPLSGVKSCPSNSWAQTGVDCTITPAAGVTCPPMFPVKCWDETCRALAADCPLERPCPQDDSNPANIQPYLCQGGSCARNMWTCTQPSPCLAVTPIKCPGSSLAQPYQRCVTTLSQCYDLTNQSIILQCPNSASRCADGSCQGQCPGQNIVCPHYIPILCPDGKCTTSLSDCAAQKSPNGCGTGINRCWDGACAAGPTTPCTSGTLDQTNGVLPNACPMQAPYKCPNGLCTVSSMACPMIPQSVVPCAAGKPVQCARGTCVMTPEQCPAIYPCVNGVRCADGTCAPSSSSCSSSNMCTGGTPFMCSNGLCAANQASCLDMWTGCPGGYAKCPDGLCIQNSSYPGGCTQVFSGTGCAVGMYKCWDGTCANPCPAPTTCNSADPASTCTAAPASGKTTWNTDISTPVRCYDGSQAAYAADSGYTSGANMCKPGGGPSATYLAAMNAVVCPATRPYVCHDGSCVAQTQHCPAFFPCSGANAGGTTETNARCLDMTCGSCKSAFCPAGSPVFCPDGSCRRVARECGQRPGMNCTTGTVLCFDGTCAASPQLCMTLKSSAKPTANSNVDSSCSGGTLCWNGACVRVDNSIKDPLYQTPGCPWVPSCPLTAPMRCWDGSCVNTTVTQCPAAQSCSSGIRCEDGSCRTTCLPYAGCNLTYPFLCPNAPYQCVDSQTTCALYTVATVCPGNCKKYVQVIPQTVSVPATTTILADIAVSSTNAPVVWFKIPGGGFGGAAQLRVWPISLQSLRGGVAKINGLNTPRTPEQILLSPPWQYQVDTQSSKSSFPLNFTTKAMIDRNFYVDASLGTNVVTAPCPFQTTYTAEYNAGACFGNLTVYPQKISYWSTPGGTGCDTFNFSGNVTNSSLTPPDANGKFYGCVCIKVNYVQGGNSAPYAYTSGQTVCLNFIANQVNGQGTPQNVIIGNTPANAGQCYLETDASITSVVLSGVPANCGGGSAGLIAAQDICLGTFNPNQKPAFWSCVRPSYAERIAYPVWVESWGDIATVVTGQNIYYQDTYTQAFLYIPLPPPDIIQPEGESWWQKYGKIVLGVTISMFILLLILAYAISRLIRYREKYLVEKRDAAALREEAQELDEKHGGLGVYDEEVEMIANPLVVQMQELQKQLEQTNASLSTQEELDATQMAAMDKERQRILEEIKRVKEAIAAQKKTAPTANYDAPSTNPQSTGKEGTTSLQPATSERQEIVQSAPPRRKKNEF